MEYILAFGSTHKALKAEAAGHRRRIELALAGRVDGDRNGREPPVDEVEMVRALVHEQRPGLRGMGVPAAEVVGAVVGIEEVFEVDRADLADRGIGFP